MVKNKFWPILFLISVLIFAFYEANKLNQFSKSDKEYDEDYNRTMLWLKENLEESSIILNEWRYGPNIATLANRSVITTTKVYPSEIKFVAERYKDASKFFFATNEIDAMEIIKKYGITHIFLQKTSFQYAMCKYIKICEPDNIARYSINDRELLQDIRNRLILTRMQDGKQFYNFEKIYDSKFFAVYKVMKPEKIQNDGFYEYKDLIKNAFDSRSNTKKYSEVSGMIVPHHLSYACQIIADAFKSLGREYDTIIILGPDHFGSSKYNISASSLTWETSFGKLTSDTEMIKKLNLELDEAGHVYEHSVRAILPFISYRFPGVKIVPIILNANTEQQEAIDLGRKISKFNNALIIASVDFSHDTDFETALKQDAVSIETLRKFKKDEVYSLNVDSKPSLLTLLTAMEYKNAKEVELLNYTNSGQMIKDYPKNVGYVSMVFQK